MRGRIMALYVCFWRSMPAIGALAMGYASEFVGLRLPPLVGIALVSAVVAWLWVRRKTIADALEGSPRDSQAS
jgi:MFS family permease